MDTPADPATPLKKVYQAFFDDLAKGGTKPSTIECYRYDILRFEEWLLDNGHRRSATSSTPISADSLLVNRSSTNRDLFVSIRLRIRWMTIPESVREFVAGGLWAHVVTMNRHGEPHVNLCWAGFDGDEIVFASFFDAKRAARLRRDPRVTLSFQAKEYDGGSLFPYLVVNGRASVGEGGALAVMDHLAQWYIGPGAEYPARDMPSGWTFRVAIDKIYGQGPWNDRWVEMDRASRGRSSK